MMDALSVVTQLRDLASEPQNRDVIVQDQGCLPGLVLFLDHQNTDVLFATLQVGERCWTGADPCCTVLLLKDQCSLNVVHFLILFCLCPQTLRYLAELSPNIPTMKNELGMMVSLENLIVR